MITREDLARMFPRAIPEWLDAMAEVGPMLAQFYGFNRLDWVHICGQIAAETSGLSLAKMQENMNFTTVKRILEVYSYRLGVALQREPALKAKYGTKERLAASLLRNPKELADLVYGGREGTPWRQGSKYVGRGPTQITHLNNYKAIGEEIARQPGGDAFDLVAKPQMLANDPELGIRSAFADWHIKGLSRWAQKDDCDTLSDALNTGNIRDNVKPHGLPERRRQTALAKSIWKKPIDFTAADPAPVAKQIAEKPVEPTTVKDLRKVSRKFFIFAWIKRLAVFLGIGTGGSLTLADVTEQSKGLSDVVSSLVANPILLSVVAASIAVVAVVGALEALGVIDYNEGRWTPSGAE
jgi:predicted chitinase